MRYQRRAGLWSLSVSAEIECESLLDRAFPQSIRGVWSWRVFPCLRGFGAFLKWLLVLEREKKHENLCSHEKPLKRKCVTLKIEHQGSRWWLMHWRTWHLFLLQRKQMYNAMAGFTYIHARQPKNINQKKWFMVAPWKLLRLEAVLRCKQKQKNGREVFLLLYHEHERNPPDNEGSQARIS